MSLPPLHGYLRSYEDSVNIGRASLWSCLACGMPFTFPEEAFDIGRQDVRRFIRDVIFIRRGMRDDGLVGARQWDCVESKIFDTRVVQELMGKVTREDAEEIGLVGQDDEEEYDESNFGGSGGDDNDPKWKEFDGLLASILQKAHSPERPLAGPAGYGARKQKRADSVAPFQTLQEVKAKATRSISSTRGMLLRTHPLCVGCSVLCNNVSLGSFDLKAKIPPVINAGVEFYGTADPKADLAALKGLRVLVFAGCLQIHQLLEYKRSKADPPVGQERAWKIEGLVRLHAAHILFACIKCFAPSEGRGGDRFKVLDRAGFSAWYACVFHPITELEGGDDPWSGGLGRAPAPTPPLMDLCGGRDLIGASGSRGAGDLEGLQSEEETMNAVISILERVLLVADAYPDVFDPSALAPLQGDMADGFAARMGTIQQLDIFSDSSVQWAPMCMLQGVTPYDLLRRLEAGTRGSNSTKAANQWIRNIMYRQAEREVWGQNTRIW